MPDPVVVPEYPNVPDAPGVPPVLRDPNNTDGVNEDASLATSDDPSISSSTSGPQWGIVDQSGALSIVPDSVIAVDYSKDYQVSTAPQENGAFLSYNKVERPYTVTISMTKGGALADRSAFIAALETLDASLDLYNAVTPEKTYLNGNITRVTYNRDERHAAFILAEIHMEEIRLSGTITYTQTQSASGAAQQDTGAVQAQSPTTSQSNAAEGS
jgi:hypothetical protein